MPSLAASWWKRWGWLLRLGGSAIGVLYIVRIIELDSLRIALGKLSWPAMFAAVVLIAVNVVVGAVRWRTLLSAYGAQSRPPVAQAIRLYFVAFFYNNFLPGAVTGDLMRAVVSRQSFGDNGATGAVAVVLVERALGLFAVFSLVALGLLTSGHHLADTSSLWWWSIAGVLASVISVCMLPFGRRLAPLLPGPLKSVAARLPVVTRPVQFAAAIGMSLLTQILTALAGYVLLLDIQPLATVTGALLVVPLAAATSFLPITVGGAGAREAVFIALCAKLFGMPKSDGLAVALLFWIATLAVGAIGGAWQLHRSNDRATA